MSGDFKYQCRRRPSRQHPEMKVAIVKAEEFLGAGSGGDGGESHYHDARQYEVAPSMDFTADGGGKEVPTIALLSAAELEGTPYGQVTARGRKGVRITSGPPEQPPSYYPETDGLEMQCGDSQYIHILRGMDENPSHGSMFFGPLGIIISANQGGISIKSDTKIKLAVSGGTSYIELTPSGIVMKGPLIQIN
jgi:hypothetical protein